MSKNIYDHVVKDSNMNEIRTLIHTDKLGYGVAQV